MKPLDPFRVVLAVVLLPTLAQAAEASTPVTLTTRPLTRLFVSSQPMGAAVILDGSRVGSTDGLWPVAPGEHSLFVEMEGFEPQNQRLTAREGRIEKVQLMLKPVASTTTQSSTTGLGSTTATKFIGRIKLPVETRDAALTTIRQHPEQLRWVGAQGQRRFAVACKRLPDGDSRHRVTPAMIGLAEAIVTHELLTAQSLLHAYAQTAELSDLTVLRRAVELSSDKLLIGGTAKEVERHAAAEGDFAVAMAVADATQLQTRMLEPAALEAVRTNYRDVIHAQARQLMAARDFADAVQLWRHLHQRKLISQSLYLDAARCFLHLGQKDDSRKVLFEAVETFEDEAPWSFFEKAGDLALEVKTPEGDALAENCFKLASKKLIE